MRNLKKYLRKISPYAIIAIYRKLYSIWSKTRSFLVPVYEYSGFTGKKGGLLNFSYIGWDHKILSYWLCYIFSEYDQSPNRRLIPTWKIKEYLKKNTKRIDLAMIELTKDNIKQQVSKEGGFVISRWIKMYLDVDFTLSLIGNHHSIKRHIKKHSLIPEKGYSEEDFFFFYDKMLKPYVESRHKETAVVEDYHTMLEGFKKNKSKIYFVVKDGLRMAGLYEQHEKDNPHMYAIGVLNGSDKIMRMGVIGALYYFALSDYQKNNIKYVNIGGTSPMLTDGLTVFKQNLGAKVQEIQNQDWLRLKLIPLKNTSAVKDFFKSKPFMYFEDECIYCAIFKDEKNSESEFQKLHLLAEKTGIKSIRIFCFNAKNQWSECES